MGGRNNKIAEGRRVRGGDEDVMKTIEREKKQLKF